MTKDLETVVFGGGCFWCTEAVFQRLRGVESVTSGYSGGDMENPSYEDVSAETTGHAEAIKIEYDPKVIKIEDLLAVFFSSHNPTELNRQGPDVGSQYRSVIFYTTHKQKQEAEAYVEKLEGEEVFEDPISTQVLPLTNFYQAEEYHQNYYNQNPNKSYCQLVINPKLDKLKKQYAHLLK